MRGIPDLKCIPQKVWRLKDLCFEWRCRWMIYLQQKGYECLIWLWTITHPLFLRNLVMRGSASYQYQKKTSLTKIDCWDRQKDEFCLNGLTFGIRYLIRETSAIIECARWDYTSVGTTPRCWPTSWSCAPKAGAWWTKYSSTRIRCNVCIGNNSALIGIKVIK